METTIMTDDIGMDEILAQNPDSNPGEIVEGTVVSQTDTHLIVNVGLKQEAAVSLKEFGQRIPPVGSQIPLLLLRISGPEGRPIVSWRQARERKNWDRIAAAHKNQEPVQGKIIEKVKGGFSVDIGLDAFMPSSQVDLKPLANPNDWIGQTVEVIVLEMDKSKGNVLVSRRKLAESEKATKRAATLLSIQVGQLVKGRVTSLTNFGAFVDIGGVEGLVHVSDLSWNRNDTPQKILKVGQELEVKVIKFDSATNRISLSRKVLLPHPWEGLEKRIPLGSIIKGKVKGLADFGAFVEIEPGIEGLVHVSELSWTERHKKPHGVLKPGQLIETKLIAIDRENEKISLSLKRVGPSPWESAVKKYPIGSKLAATVSHLASFGAFIKLPEGIEALLKTQDLSWTERIQSPQQVLKAGDAITVVVLEVNPQEEKMSVGLKQVQADPLKTLRLGQKVNGIVSKVIEPGFFVKLESGLEGFVRNSEAQHGKSMFSEPLERGQKAVAPAHSYKEGDAVTASVAKINKKERKIDLSIRRFEQDQERELLKKYTQADRPTLGETTGWGSENSNEPPTI